jgi:hypothetical protein
MFIYSVCIPDCDPQETKQVSMIVCGRHNCSHSSRTQCYVLRTLLGVRELRRRPRPLEGTLGRHARHNNSGAKANSCTCRELVLRRKIPQEVSLYVIASMMGPGKFRKALGSGCERGRHKVQVVINKETPNESSCKRGRGMWGKNGRLARGSTQWLDTGPVPSPESWARS